MLEPKYEELRKSVRSVRSIILREVSEKDIFLGLDKLAVSTFLEYEDGDRFFVPNYGNNITISGAPLTLKKNVKYREVGDLTDSGIHKMCRHVLMGGNAEGIRVPVDLPLCLDSSMAMFLVGEARSAGIRVHYPVMVAVPYGTIVPLDVLFELEVMGHTAVEINIVLSELFLDWRKGNNITG